MTDAKPTDPSQSRTIPLTQGQVAIVDASDYEWLMQWTWYASRHHGGSWYAARRRPSREGGGAIMMHRQINMTPPDYETDHINANKLDNRRRNLRSVTPDDNKLNGLGVQRNNTTGYTGVHKTREGRFKAEVSYRGHKYCCGTFSLADVAAIARDIKAIHLHGKYATLNF